LGKRILVIASYCGDDRRNPYNYLKYQLESLERLRHKLDDVVVVENAGHPTADYLESQAKFDKILHRPNIRGSYGAWNYAWETYGDEYEWYFYLEDDYVFALDNFDDKLIAMWEPGVGHLCSLYYDHGRVGWHVAMPNGLISAEGWRVADFSHFNTVNVTPIYEPEIQISWGNSFINSPLRVKSIVPTYDTPFYVTGETRNLCNSPAIIVPIGLPPPLPQSEQRTKLPMLRELVTDRHLQRLIDDPEYAVLWNDPDYEAKWG
jgi:hypothetical protein